MKRSNLAGFLALAAVAVLCVFSQADALQSTKAYKVMMVTFVVTPSPTPLAFAKPVTHPAAPVANIPVPPELAKLFADPFSPQQVASSGSAFDVPPAMVAQAAPVQGSPVPVQFVVKPDPNAAYLHLVGPSLSEYDVPYGTTKVTCAFQVFTYYTTIYKLTDWAYGTVHSGGTPAFPMENYPITSYLSWAVPDFSTTLHAFSNGGTPGEQTWAGTAGQSQQHCVDLTITVPASQPPGTFPAPIQYVLIVN